jgi:hypothetical protein
MTKRISKIILLVFSIMVILMPSVLAYENDKFQFELPDNYIKVDGDDVYIFTDPNSERGMIIYTKEDHNLKKSAWNIDDDDFDRLVAMLSLGGRTVSKNKRAKLGKEKAAEAMIESNGTYIDVYIMASNKYIYMVCLVGESKSDLECSDFQKIKKTFKLKDHTTNPTVIYILVIGIVVAISLFLKNKKQKGGNIGGYNGNNVDYKNMTEDDFKNM